MKLYPPFQPKGNSTDNLGHARTLTPVVMVHARIADSYRSGESALWYYLRWLDQAGTGVVEFVITEACEVLNVSRMTVGRWLDSGIGKRFFRAVIKSYGRATVYLGALEKVAAHLGLERLGATARVPISRLQHLKLTATEVTADVLQACSHYAMRQQLKEQDPGRAKLANTLENVFLTPSESSTGVSVGHVLHVGKRCAFVDQNFTAFGVSQEGIAEYMSRSTATIRRRLSNAHRTQRRKPAPLVLKRQLAQLHPELSSPDAIQDLELAKHELRTPELNRFFSFTRSDKVKVFFALTNLYWNQDIEIASYKAGKWRYKNFVRQCEGKPPETPARSREAAQAKPAREGRESSKPNSKPVRVYTTVETVSPHVKPSNLVRSRVPVLRHRAGTCVCGLSLDLEQSLDPDLRQGS